MKLFLPILFCRICILFTIWGCKENVVSFPESSSMTNKHHTTLIGEDIKTLPIDVAKSKIVWRGTKLGGIRGHEGTLGLEKGHLLLINDSIVGGSFIANMQSLEVTDIPNEQATAKNSLRNHLKSEFKTETYPQSSFEITNVEYAAPGKFEVRGKLKIMGIEKNIAAPFLLAETRNSKKIMTTTIKLNRQDWNIGEEAGWLEKRLVDKHFNLEVTIAY